MTSEVRFATRQDLEAYYKDDPVYYSSRAVVVVQDGEVVGVGGICRVGIHHLIFSDMREGRVSKKDIVRAARMVLELASRYTSVIAYADEELATSRGFIEHFGFQPTGISGEHGEILMKVNKPWTK